MSKKHLFTFASLLAVAAVVFGYQRSRAPATPKEDKDVAAVRAVLESQAAAWNRGDIEGYMEGYAKEDTTEVVSGDNIMRGRQAVLERYTARYDTRAKMGTLTFSGLDIKQLSEAEHLCTWR